MIRPFTTFVTRALLAAVAIWLLRLAHTTDAFWWPAPLAVALMLAQYVTYASLRTWRAQ